MSIGSRRDASPDKGGDGSPEMKCKAQLTYEAQMTTNDARKA